MTLQREPIELDTKRCFDARQKAKLFERSGGLCEVDGCGNKIQGTWIAGHYPIPHNLGGRTILSNGRVEGKCCSGGTQAEDTKVAAKTKRMAGETGQYARRQRRLEKAKHALENGTPKKKKEKIGNRGFYKGNLKRKMNGDVVSRSHPTLKE